MPPRPRRRSVVPLAGEIWPEPLARSHFLLRLREADGREPEVKRLPGAKWLAEAGLWSVPALPGAGAALRRLVRSYADLSLSVEAEDLLSELEGLLGRQTDGLVRAGFDHRRPVFTFVFLYLPNLVDAVKALPGRTYDDGLRRWVVPASPEAIAQLAELLDAWPSLVPDAQARLWLANGPTQRECRLVLEHGRHGEHFAVCRGCADEHAVPELYDIPELGVRHATNELLVPAVAEAAEPLRALIDGSTELDVDPDVPERLTRLETAAREAAELRALSVAQDSSLTVTGLGGTLRPFQRAGVEYLLRTRRTFVADEQGLGKTIQALAGIQAADAFPAVVVCPASLKLNWRKEIDRWLPGRTVQVVGRRSEGAEIGVAEITVVNYEQLSRQEEPLTALSPRALILDESHYCKNPKAQRTKAARRLATTVSQDGLVLALTGTPLLNRPMELVPQLELLGRLREFGGFGRFIKEYSRGEGLERLHRQLRETCFVRRRKVDVLPQLPAKQRTVVPVELANRPDYESAERDVVHFLRERAAAERRFLATLEGLPEHERQAAIRARADDAAERALRAEPLVRLTALKQLAARGKLPAAIEWIEDFLASSEKLVVFAHHRDALAGLLEAFPGAAHVLGDDREEVRHASVERFQDDPECRLVICSQAAGGLGLTLTAASNVAFLELGWNPAVHDQAEDRVHRIGQERQVTAWYLLAADTIDEPIAELIEAKRAVISATSDGQALAKASVLGDLVERLVDEPEEDDEASRFAA